MALSMNTEIAATTSGRVRPVRRQIQKMTAPRIGRHTARCRSGPARAAPGATRRAGDGR